MRSIERIEGKYGRQLQQHGQKEQITDELWAVIACELLPSLRDKIVANTLIVHQY